jgi:hypothetical protein
MNQNRYFYKIKLLWKPNYSTNNWDVMMKSIVTGMVCAKRISMIQIIISANAEIIQKARFAIGMKGVYKH